MESASLNIPQQVFVVFYAIAWGTAANVQGRWKAFSYAALEGEKKPVVCRLALSWLLLNIAPVVFFVCTLSLLNAGPWHLSLCPFTFGKFVRMVAAIVPALAPFAFYKLWMGIVQAGKDEWFYKKSEVCALKRRNDGEDPFIGAVPNILSGLLILVGAIVVVCICSLQS